MPEIVESVQLRLPVYRSPTVQDPTCRSPTMGVGSPNRRHDEVQDWRPHRPRHPRRARLPWPDGVADWHHRMPPTAGRFSAEAPGPPGSDHDPRGQRSRSAAWNRRAGAGRLRGAAGRSQAVQNHTAQNQMTQDQTALNQTVPGQAVPGLPGRAAHRQAAWDRVAPIRPATRWPGNPSPGDARRLQ